MKNSAVLALTVVCACIVGGNARSPRVGGLGKTQVATSDIQTLVDSVRGDIIAQLPLGYNRETDLQLKARSYREQLVAGKNYFIKVQTGPARFIHVKIYKDLRGVVSLSGVQLGKSTGDPIQYF